MVLTESTVMPPGTSAPAFTLPDTRTGDSVSLSEFANQPILVAFICNHCPYVVHLIDQLADTAHELASSGIATVAISANDAQRYPADAPDKMKELAISKGFQFPYCYDESQNTARAYSAVCTPDLYLFDQQHKLYYRGQFDETRPGKGTAHGQHLKNAAASLLAGEPAPVDPPASVGCSIKWKS